MVGAQTENCSFGHSGSRTGTILLCELLLRAEDAVASLVVQRVAEQAGNGVLRGPVGTIMGLVAVSLDGTQVGSPRHSPTDAHDLRAAICGRAGGVLRHRFSATGRRRSVFDASVFSAGRASGR